MQILFILKMHWTLTLFMLCHERAGYTLERATSTDEGTSVDITVTPSNSKPQKYETMSYGIVTPVHTTVSSNSATYRYGTSGGRGTSKYRTSDTSTSYATSVQDETLKHFSSSYVTNERLELKILESDSDTSAPQVNNDLAPVTPSQITLTDHDERGQSSVADLSPPSKSHTKPFKDGQSGLRTVITPTVVASSEETDRTQVVSSHDTTQSALGSPERQRSTTENGTGTTFDKSNSKQIQPQVFSDATAASDIVTTDFWRRDVKSSQSRSDSIHSTDSDSITPTYDFSKTNALSDSALNVYLNPSACNPNVIYTIRYPSRSVDVRQSPQNRSVICKWQITAPQECALEIETHVYRVVNESKGTALLNVLEEANPKNNQMLCVSCASGVFHKLMTISLDAGEFLFNYRSHVIDGEVSFRLYLRPVTYKLPINYTQSNVSGYITSPGYGQWTEYYKYLNASVSVHVPQDHIILISFFVFELEQPVESMCKFDSLALYGESEVDSIWTRCGSHAGHLEVYNQSIKFQFITDGYMERLGFKLFFTILPKEQEPIKFDNGLYDCSVPHYSSFAGHLSCDLVQECNGAEDEINCPHTSGDCLGMISTGNKCYTYFLPKTNYTWYDAYSECKDKQLDLIMPRTLQDRDDFKQITRFLHASSSEAYMGLRTAQSSAAAVPSLYREVWQWSDRTMGYYIFFLNEIENVIAPMCSKISVLNQRPGVMAASCNARSNVYLVCEREKSDITQTRKPSVQLSALNRTDARLLNGSIVECPDGHLAHNFLSCDPSCKCLAVASAEECRVDRVSVVPMFACDSISQTVHYSLVCDHRRHCSDGSDEEFCVFPSCQGTAKCRNQQCVLDTQVCDGMQHCVDGSDENCAYAIRGSRESVPPPAIVRFDNKGRYETQAVSASNPCPGTHFQCSDGLCLPVFLRCNGVDDCLGREDEFLCDTYSCPGFYRCRDSVVCLHLDNVCDGVLQCPQQDDELYCNISCPDGCACQGLAFVCSRSFHAEDHPYLRYLNAHGSGMKLEHFHLNVYLVELKLTKCDLRTVANMSNGNLRKLDLSKNILTSVDMNTFSALRNLRVLVLSENPLSEIYKGEYKQLLNNLRTIDISITHIETYDSQMFSNVPSLQYLNMSYGTFTAITRSGFNTTNKLESLDLRGSPVRYYPFDMLLGLNDLKVMYSDDFRLCCQAILPVHFDMANCHTQMDEIASCDDLLRSNVYRVFLWIFASLALIGNIGSFIARFRLQNQASTSQTSFSMFVTNLSIADLLMGAYLAMIGVADQVYRGKYLWYDEQWKRSPACKMAGFLSLLSSEVSAFNICLITLDRFLVLRFPFKRFHFRKWSAAVACGITWIVGALLAAIPLMPMTSNWEFYSQNGICIPLPITRSDGHFKGHAYAFGVVIVLNFILFILIAVGQMSVYWSIRTNSISSATKSSSREATIARRLATVVLSDFLCWFPIGVLGLLASTGTRISSEVNVGIAIFVLPFNSALNPFLYTFNVIFEKRRKAMESCIATRLESRHVSAMTSISSKDGFQDLKLSKENLLAHLDRCLEQKVITPEDIASHLSLQQTTEFYVSKETLLTVNEHVSKEEASDYVQLWLGKGILSFEELITHRI